MLKYWPGCLSMTGALPVRFSRRIIERGLPIAVFQPIWLNGMIKYVAAFLSQNHKNLSPILVNFVRIWEISRRNIVFWIFLYDHVLCKNILIPLITLDVMNCLNPSPKLGMSCLEVSRKHSNKLNFYKGRYFTRILAR